MSNDSNSSPHNNDENYEPQCNLIVGINKLNLLDRGDTSQPNNNDISYGDGNVEGGGGVCCLQTLSDDVLLNVLLYCGPTDVEENVKLVNRRFQ